jgi:lipoprotein-anchoring transpeptidase ErfK/SrfK
VNRRNQIVATLALVVVVGAVVVYQLSRPSKPQAAPRPAPTTTTTTTEPAKPDPWQVEVAWAKNRVDSVVVYPTLPKGTLLTPAKMTLRSVPEPAPPAVAATLEPIPSPTLNWGSGVAGTNFVFDNPTKIGNPLVFLVTEDHGDWLRVYYPGRPNHAQGWIRRSDVTITRHDWHITIDVTHNELSVYKGTKVVVRTGTVDGTSATPTPLGRFYVNEKQKHYPSSPVGSWVISTNGFSDTLDRFGGTVPIFAMHGTPYASTIGSDLSHGCVRVPNPVIEQMAAEVPLGAPVDIVH